MKCTEKGAAFVERVCRISCERKKIFYCLRKVCLFVCMCRCSTVQEGGPPSTGPSARWLGYQKVLIVFEGVLLLRRTKVLPVLD